MARREQSNAARVLEATAIPPFITHGERSKLLKLHRIAVGGDMAIPPFEWRAVCGFRFAFCPFERHTSSADFKRDQLCAICFQLESRDVESSSSPSEEALPARDEDSLSSD